MYRTKEVANQVCRTLVRAIWGPNLNKHRMAARSAGKLSVKTGDCSAIPALPEYKVEYSTNKLRVFSPKHPRVIPGDPQTSAMENNQDAPSSAQRSPHVQNWIDVVTEEAREKSALESEIDNLRAELQSQKGHIRDLQVCKDKIDFNSDHLKDQLKQLRTALQQEKERNKDLLGIIESRPQDPPGDGEMKLKYETLEAENREMHVRNSTLAYDIDCLRAKNGKLESRIEQAMEATPNLPPEEEILKLGLSGATDDELLADFLKLDSSVRSWCEEWISASPPMTHQEEPRPLPIPPFNDQEIRYIRYTIADYANHALPLAIAIVWRCLEQIVYSNPLSDLVTDLWTTRGNAASIRTLEAQFYGPGRSNDGEAPGYVTF
jgi:hypothetical protein